MLTKRFVILAIAILSSVFPARHSSGEQVPNPGFALSFDGADDRLTVPRDPSFPDAVYTVSAWIQTSSSAVQQIMSRGEDPVSDALTWGFGITGGHLYLQIENGSSTGQIVEGEAVVTDGRLYHVAVTRSVAGEVVFYVNGVVDATYADTVDPLGSSSHDLQIGFSIQSEGPPSQDPNNFFDGCLDGVTLWEIALDLQAIQMLFERSTPGDAEGLLGYWELDEGQGQIAGDLSGPPILSGLLGLSADQEVEDPQWKFPSPVAAPETVPSQALVQLQVAPTPSHTLRPSIHFTLPTQSDIEFRLIGSNGRLEGEPIRGHYGTGDHVLDWPWDWSKAAAGVSFVILNWQAGSESTPVIHLR